MIQSIDFLTIGLLIYVLKLSVGHQRLVHLIQEVSFEMEMTRPVITMSLSDTDPPSHSHFTLSHQSTPQTIQNYRRCDNSKIIPSTQASINELPFQICISISNHLQIILIRKRCPSHSPMISFIYSHSITLICY